MKPLWLLDVDGVINCVGLFDHDSTVKKTRANGYSIRYRPELIKRINRLHDEQQVEIQWLTTWHSDAPMILAPEIELGDFPVLMFAEEEWRSDDASWWKARAVRRWCAMHDVTTGGVRPLIWTDDDLGYAQSKNELAWMKGRPDTLLLSPNPASGIADAQMLMIERFCREQTIREEHEW